jgi:hypothetical protein
MPGLFGSSGGQTKQEKALTTTETNIANYGLSQAQSTLPTATSGLESSLSFFQTLLSGNRNAIAAEVAPDVENIETQYDTAQKANAEFAPRGGGATAAQEESRFQEAASIAPLFTQARETGATGAASVSDMIAQLGLGELGVSSSTAANTVGQLQTSQQMQQQQQAAAGSAIGGLIALLA